MSKVAVVYWTGSGNTEAMAAAVAKGAEAKGATVEQILAADFSLSAAEEYDAYAFGCPAMGAEELEDREFQPMWGVAASSQKSSVPSSFVTVSCQISKFICLTRMFSSSPSRSRSVEVR